MYQGSSEKQDQMSYNCNTYTTEKQQVEPTTQVKLATSTRLRLKYKGWRINRRARKTKQRKCTSELKSERLHKKLLELGINTIIK